MAEPSMDRPIPPRCRGGARFGPTGVHWHRRPRWPRSSSLLFALLVLSLLTGPGCGVLALSAAGGAIALTGEPQRLIGTEGREFDANRIALIEIGKHTPLDVESIMGLPQAKHFTAATEEWSYRYRVPASSLREGREQVLTVIFEKGLVREMKFTVSAL